MWGRGTRENGGTPDEAWLSGTQAPKFHRRHAVLAVWTLHSLPITSRTTTLSPSSPHHTTAKPNTKYWHAASRVLLSLGWTGIESSPLNSTRRPRNGWSRPDGQGPRPMQMDPPNRGRRSQARLSPFRIAHVNCGIRPGGIAARERLQGKRRPSIWDGPPIEPRPKGLVLILLFYSSRLPVCSLTQVALFITLVCDLFQLLCHSFDFGHSFHLTLQSPTLVFDTGIILSFNKA